MVAPTGGGRPPGGRGCGGGRGRRIHGWSPAGGPSRRCADARTGGAAPLDRGEPGHRPELDRDGDGVAGEPELATALAHVEPHGLFSHFRVTPYAPSARISSAIASKLLKTLSPSRYSAERASSATAARSSGRQSRRTSTVPGSGTPSFLR
ncbi:excalibur calcium-binding domain-containing protein [Streptomyces sp. NPDC091268]|uniref:excalibur calcium-binding domain-containing protein n=1 Tax=Streptomyces sp. NPDC091268 TaxID=3365979 RepID=UPI0038073908